MVFGKRMKVGPSGLLVALATSLAIAGCGGGGGGGGTTSAGTGDVSVAVTDAPSDEIERFEVDVTSVNLTKANGAEVAVLPATKRVDFAQLVTVSDLLTAFTVPAGAYTGISITMDFSTANVVIAGNSSPATVTDQTGAALTGSVKRSIAFENGKGLLIAPGLNKMVSIDFDLDSSCAVDAAANTVALGPVLKAEAEPQAPKITQIGGVIASVDSAGSSFMVELKLAGSPATRPQVKVQTDSSTLFMVNGAKADFAALAAQPTGSPVLAQGNLDLASKTFLARSVESWPALDGAEGHVISRTSDGVLTIKGAAVELADGTYLVNQVITVDARGAKVYKRGVQGSLGTDAIGVGQRILARGKLNGSNLDSTQAGVCLIETGIFGYANASASGGTLSIKLDRFDGRPVTLFNFNVGGTATADPANYTIDVGTLDVSSVTSGTPVAIRGFVAPWNAPASTAEAQATTVVNRQNVCTPIYVTWPLGKAAPFSAIDASGLTLDLKGSLKRIVDPGFVAPIQLADTDTPRIVPGGFDGKWAIIQNGGVTIYSSYATFEADAATKIAGGAKALGFTAIGKWDASTKTLTAGGGALGLQ